MEKDKGGRERGQAMRFAKTVRAQRGRGKTTAAKSQVSCQMGQAPYLGNKNGDSLLRMSDSPILVHFFNCFFFFFPSPLETDGSYVSQQQSLRLVGMYSG